MNKRHYKLGGYKEKIYKCSTLGSVTRGLMSHRLGPFTLKPRERCYTVSVLGPCTTAAMSLRLCIVPAVLTLDDRLLH